MEFQKDVPPNRDCGGRQLPLHLWRLSRHDPMGCRRRGRSSAQSSIRPTLECDAIARDHDADYRVKRLIGVKMIGTNTARPFLARTMVRRQFLEFALRYVDLTLSRSRMRWWLQSPIKPAPFFDDRSDRPSRGGSALWPVPPTAKILSAINDSVEHLPDIH